MRRARHPRRGRDQLRLRRGEERRGRRRATPSCARIAERYGMVVCGPNSEGLVNPLKPLVATFSPVFHDPSRAAPAEGEQGAADRGQLPERRADLLVPQPRPGPATAIHLSGQRRQPNGPRSARLCRLGGSTPAAPTSSCVYLEGIRDPARFREVAERPPSRQADDRRQGRPLRRRAARGRVAYRRAGAAGR